MGHWRFAVFYLLCGAVAGLTHAAVEPASQIPTIGASGAVSGVLGAYFMLHRRGVWILVFFMPIRFPAWGVLEVWIGYQVINALADAGGGVAWYAHVGGFVAGALLVPMRKRGVPLFDRGFVRARRRTPYRPPPDAEVEGAGPWEEPAADSRDDGAAPSGKPNGSDRTGPWGRRPPGPWSRRD